jgi:hypothetical protein
VLFILDIFTVSIATCNKLFNPMTLFNGDKIWPRVTVKAGGYTFSWLFNTGTAATCMNPTSFFAAFPASNLEKFEICKIVLQSMDIK